MKIVAIIPARMGSSRFPGKPLEKIDGKPMIGHVYDNVSECQALTKTIVATCDNEIQDYVQSIEGEALMTSKEHERASDRCAEALIALEKKDKVKYDIVVMVQGDEPMINSKMIEQAIKPLITDKEVQVSNLLGEIKDEIEFEDRNCIKVVCDLSFNALYFSREPIPTRSKTKNIIMGKQICVIPFKRDFLVEYTNMDPSPLEIIESIDMMRVLENGKKVRMVKTPYQSQSVDTKEDLVKVEKFLKGHVKSIN